MSTFQEMAAQYAEADDTFEKAVVAALAANDDARFDLSMTARDRNDQAYFLFLCTRLEGAVHEAFRDLVNHRAVGTWRDARAWKVWQSRMQDSRDRNRIEFMLKVEFLLEKGRQDCEYVRMLYGHRNKIGHGEEWGQPFAIQSLAERMHEIVEAFAKT